MLAWPDPIFYIMEKCRLASVSPPGTMIANADAIALAIRAIK